MIKVTIREAAERRGITKAYQLAKAVGIPQSLAARLWKGDVYPLVKTLHLLCEQWKCKLTDLIQWVPDAEVARPAKVGRASKRIVRKTKARKVR